VLLHRWGLKWGIRPAIVLTSILFGLLHSNLIGLFAFGVVMSLLYLTTRSLLVPIVAHGINNALSSALDILWAPPTTQAANTLAEFRASWWLGVICLLLSAPWVLRYVIYNWPDRQTQLPYFANQGCSQPE
jgi:membrane protease YdiL (CAAX protease family)